MSFISSQIIPTKGTIECSSRAIPTLYTSGIQTGLTCRCTTTGLISARLQSRHNTNWKWVGCMLQSFIAGSFLGELEKPVSEHWHDLEPGIEDVRKRLARIWNADPECIAITRNASESLQIAQFGLELQPGDEVLTTSQDYPRMISTWQQRERRDKIVLKQLNYDVPVHSSADLLRMFEQGITTRTRVIHVSQVVFMTGQIMPVKEICALARARGITSIVDGAHAFAHVPFQFQDCDCDFYGASLHKWLSAPIGTGMLYVRKDRIEKHWALMAAPPSMDKNIRKFEEIGTHPAAMHNATLQALEFHEQIGAERKFARLRYLKNRWAERLSKVPSARVLVELAPNQSGAFGTIHFDTIEPGKLYEALLTNYNILVTPIS